MNYESDKHAEYSLNHTAKNIEQSLKVVGNYTPQESNVDKGQMEARQRVFNHLPEYKKR